MAELILNALDRSIYTDPTSFPLLISLRIVSQNSIVANLVDRLLRDPYRQSVRRFCFQELLLW